VTEGGAFTLLLRLAGPMQSWGLDSRFDQRDTGREPSKSGVLGLLCAALGKPRDDRVGKWPQLETLAQLRMGVRVIREGDMRVDYQTAGGGIFPGRKSYGVWKASGGVGGTVVSPRQYLADADFLVGLEGSETLLRLLEDALRAPVWPLSLGRKSYVPAMPVVLPRTPPGGPAIREGDLDTVLCSYRDDSGDSSQHLATHSQRFVLEVPLAAAAERRTDVPLSFDRREFGVRGVVTTWRRVTK
jgi:CRISPR system Cascade subunit CasD